MSNRMLLVCLALTVPAIAAVAVLALAGPALAQESKETLPFPGGYVTLPVVKYWQTRQFPSDGGSFAVRTLTPTHSVAAIVQYQLASTNFEAFLFLTQGRQKLREIMEFTRESFNQGRYNLHVFEFSPIDWKKYACMDYRTEFDDLEVLGDKETAYPGLAKGRACILTDREGLFLVLLKVQYSERRATSEKPYGRFDAEAREYLDGIVVEK